MKSKNSFDLSSVFELINRLRDPENGCPWDRKQTHESMAKYLVEEACEANDAIHTGGMNEIIDELGDTLFILCFIIHLFSEKGEFTFSDIVKNTVSKMISRHPHVFGEEEANTPEDVEKTWERVKKEERFGKEKSVFDKIPSALPSLMLALKLSKAAVNAGFEWENIDGVIDKVNEEVSEFKESLENSDFEASELEFGDILFTLVNVGRFAKIDSETALLKSSRKFEKRFRWMEKEAFSMGSSIENIDRNLMESLWDKSKKIY